MIPILIAYGTSEGQARRIAEFMGHCLTEAGWHADVVDTSAVQRSMVQPVYAAAIVGGSVHLGHHSASLRKFVDEHAEWLGTIPVAFFSVSLTAAHDDPHSRAESERMLREFLAQSGLAPTKTQCFAGALRYSRYGFLKRLLMKRIARKEGGGADATRDYEYTDWRAVREFALRFARDHAGPSRQVA